MGKKAPSPQQQTQTVPQSAKARNRNQLVTWFIIFICGFVAGVAFSVYRGGSTPQAPQAPTGVAQQGDNDFQQAIISLEAEVTAHPDNSQAWTRLGNVYFDSNQPQKAIGAYQKALELGGDDPNILTDLGVMYRRDNQPDQAIAAFDKAIAAAPNHQQARFNKGIVLFYDKNDRERGIQTWEELLKINPQATTGSGESVREIIEAARKAPAAEPPTQK